MEREARREAGRDERSGIICRKEIFDRKPYIVPNKIVVKCELRDVIFSFAMALFLRKSVWVFLVVIRADVGFGIFRFQYCECYRITNYYIM